MNAETVRVLLAGCVVAMYVLAMFSLRRRPLTLGQFTAWGLFALFILALGPYLVILTPPETRLAAPAPVEFGDNQL